MAESRVKQVERATIESLYEMVPHESENSMRLCIDGDISQKDFVMTSETINLSTFVVPLITPKNPYCQHVPSPDPGSSRGSWRV